MRRLRSDGITESFAAILDDPAGRQVTARRLLPHVLRDRAQLREIEGRARQLVEVRHPVVVPVLDYVEVAEDRYLLEQWVDAVPLTTLLDHLRESGSTLPHNVFLNLSTQICNGLEALHARTGGESDPVLHTGLCPSSVLLQRTGKVIIGDFGLVRSPTASPGRGGGEAVTSRLEYLSPEQTHPEQRLSPASDIFSLGTVLYEMLTLKPMFRSKSNLQTIHRVRRAEVTSHLLEVKEILPGVDRVLYRALSLNPRHRYQRAFVLREDLRGLMAGFSFARIEEETQAVLAPLFMTRGAESMEDVLLDRPPDVGETTASLIAAPLSAPVAVPTLDRMAPPLGVAAPTPRTLIPTDDSEMLDRPEEGAFESEESTDIRDPADLPNRQPTMPLEVEDLDATEEPGSVDDADEEDGGAEPSPPEDGTSWFPRVPAGSSDPSEGVTEHAPVSLMANPIDPDALAADTEATTLREDFDTVAFEDEVNTEVKATPAPLASPDAKPAPAAGPKGEAGKSGSRKRRRKKKRRGRRAAGAASSQSAEANSPPAAKPPPRPAPAPVAAKTDTPVPRPAAADDDLDWRQDRGGGGWMLGIGAVVGVLALSVVLCIGLGGTGALLGASSVDNASTALATPDPEPPGRLPPAPKPAEAPEDPGLSEPTIAERPEPEPEPERPAAPRPAPAVAVQPAPAPQPPPRPRVAPVAPRPAPAVAARPAPAPAPPPVAPRPAPAPRPAVASVPSPPPAPRPAVVSNPRPAPAPPPVLPPPPPAEDDAVADAMDVQPPPPEDFGALGVFADAAYSGRLSASDRDALEAVPRSDEAAFDRANTFLYQDAKARGSLEDRATYLDTLFSLAPNRYRPELLVEDAELAVRQQDWDHALSQASLADQHWARIPGDLVFTRRAMIHEVRAQASLGKFYSSGGEDLDALDDAIRGWQDYRDHVDRRARADLLARADRQLARLRDMQERMQ